jgi:hypothetical protein
MGMFLPKSSKSNAAKTNAQIISGVRVNQSTYASILPVAICVNRVPMSLIGLWDFLRTAHTTPGTHQGKGIGGQGSSPASTSYTFSTAFQAALCLGPVDHIDALWTSAGKIPVAVKTTDYTVPGGGGSIDITDAGFRGDRGVGAHTAYSQPVSDFGADGGTTLAGTYNVPLVAGAVSAPGVYVMSVPSAGVTRYTFHSADAGKTVTINYSSTLAIVQLVAEIVIPGSATYSVPDPTNYVGNSSISYVVSGNQLFGPGDTAIAGHFAADNSGNFTFNAGDIGQSVIIKYQSKDPNTDAATTLNYSLIQGTTGQGSWSYLSGKHQADSMPHANVATIQSADLELGNSDAMPQYSFETVSNQYAAGAGIVGANPADVITGILTDPVWGVNFPSGLIGDWSNARSFWQANGFFIHLLQDSQSTGSDVIKTILDAGQGAFFWNNGKLCIAVYGDTSAAGNGAIYTPDTQPIVEFSVDDTIASAGAEPIKVETKAEDSIFNRVKVEFLNAANDYNVEILMEDDPASIQTHGLHEEGQQAWHFIRDYPVAQWAANLRLKHMTNIRDQYTYTVTPRYRHLIAPMKLVTVTWSAMGWAQKPMRILKIEEDHNGLNLLLEEFPYGVCKPTLYAKQTPQAINANPALINPGNTNIVALEIPDSMNGYAGRTVRIYANPVTPNNWGGADILVSNDNITYNKIDQLKSPVVIGTLGSSMTTGTGDPDTQSITVTVSNGLQILPASAADFSAKLSLIAIVDLAGTFEIVAYQNAALTGINVYTVDTFHRGLFGTTRAAHSSGASFVELGEVFAEFQYPATSDGSTVYIKAASFNQMQGRLQDAGTLTPVSLVLSGSHIGFFNQATGQLYGLSQVPDDASFKKTTPAQIQYIDPTTGVIPTSTPLTKQGAVVPAVGLPVTVNLTPTSIEVVTTNQTRWFGDGNTIVVLASDTTFSSLANSTNYYIYMRYNTTTGVISFGHGAGTPPTAPSSQFAANCSFDGFSPLGLLIIQTQASGGGGGSGGGSSDTGGCPEGAELVDIQGRGEIASRDVAIGDYILGENLATGEDVYRRVTNVTKHPNSTWRVVDSHRVTQRETIWYNGAWVPAYTVAKDIDVFVGATVFISVEADTHDDHNYSLVGGTRRLTIHNPILPRS